MELSNTLAHWEYECRPGAEERSYGRVRLFVWTVTAFPGGTTKILTLRHQRNTPESSGKHSWLHPHLLSLLELIYNLLAWVSKCLSLLLGPTLLPRWPFSRSATKGVFGDIIADFVDTHYMVPNVILPLGVSHSPKWSGKTKVCQNKFALVVLRTCNLVDRSDTNAVDSGHKCSNRSIPHIHSLHWNE